MNKTLKKNISNANKILKDLFKDETNFEFIKEDENTYEFRLKIGDGVLDISVFKDVATGSMWIDYFFDWVRNCLVNRWKHQNMEWS